MKQGDFVQFKDPKLFPLFEACGKGKVLMVTAEHPKMRDVVQVSNGVLEEWVRRCDLVEAEKA